MGSGKTGATLYALQGIELLDEAPALILGPRRVAVGSQPRERGVWVNEAAKWDGLDVEVVPIKGNVTERFQALKRDVPFHSINYEQLPWLVEHLGMKRWPYRTIVADESTRLKGHRLLQGGQRTKALARVAWLPQVERFVELTGTPSPNGLKDLWGQLWFLDRGARLGKSYSDFSQRWFRPSRDGYGVEPFRHSQDEIQDRIRDICITIDPRDYGLKLDEPIERVIEVELPPKAREMYREMERKMYLEIVHDLGTHEIEAVSAAGRTNKCLQLANGAIYYDDKRSWAEVHTAKFEALESIVEEAGGMPVLVAYQFVSDLERLRKHFPKGLTLDQTTEADWNDGRVPLLFAHPASAGHGLNLQHGSNILVDLSSGWDLELDDQIIERIGPMRQFQSGLDRPVYRYRIEAVDTVDQLVRLRRQSKRSVQDILLEAMKRRGDV